FLQARAGYPIRFPSQLRFSSEHPCSAQLCFSKMVRLCAGREEKEAAIHRVRACQLLRWLPHFDLRTRARPLQPGELFWGLVAWRWLVLSDLTTPAEWVGRAGVVFEEFGLARRQQKH